MPLVQIHLLQGKPIEFRHRVGEITEHDENGLIYDPEYLDIQRTDEIIIIQITLNEGRTVKLKKAFYKRLTERLHSLLGIRMEDVFISLVEVKKENWSFGNGVAQYAR
jgi:4-oxalocrotonate tautomerase